MKVKLRTAWLKFNHACYKKLERKERRGFWGCEKLENKKQLESDLYQHVLKPLDQGNLTDIANYCNFLWNLIEDQKGDKDAKQRSII